MREIGEFSMSQETVNAEVVRDKKKFKRKGHFKPRTRACKFKIAAPNGKIYHYNDLKEWITKYGANYPELVEESVEIVYEKLIETRDRFIEEKIATDYKGWKLLTTRFDKHDNDNQNTNQEEVNEAENQDNNEAAESQADVEAKTEERHTEKSNKKTYKKFNNRKKREKLLNEDKPENKEELESGQKKDKFQNKKKSKPEAKAKDKGKTKPETKAEDKDKAKLETKVQKKKTSFSGDKSLKQQKQAESKLEKKAEKKADTKADKQQISAANREFAKNTSKQTEDKYSQILKNAEAEIASIQVQPIEEEKKQGLGNAIKGFFAGIFGKRED